MPSQYSCCSDHQWNDCPDTESAGRNSCYFSKENTSVLWNYHIRLIIENVTFDERSFVMDEIGESMQIPKPASICTSMVNPLHIALQCSPYLQNIFS